MVHAGVTSRSLTPKGQATRGRIVDAAATLMFERGVGRTSLDDVGDAAGVGKSQLYHYFADKADLIQAVIAQQTEAIVGTQEDFLSHLDSWEGWQQWRDAVVGYQLRHGCVGGCPLGSLASELADTDDDARVSLDRSFARWEAAFIAGLEAMRDRKLLKADADTSRLAVTMLASLQGGLLLCQTRKDVAPLEAALDSALAHLRTFARPSRPQRTATAV
jgi:AcrR family transcriptional regulator